MYRNKKSSSMKKKHSLVNLTFINGFHCQCVRIWNGRLFHTTWPVSINHYAFEIIREPKYIVSLTIHSLTHSKSFSICNGVDHNHQWTMFMSVCVCAFFFHIVILFSSHLFASKCVYSQCYSQCYSNLPKRLGMLEQLT